MAMRHSGWGLAWSNLWRKVGTRCGDPDCGGADGIWDRAHRGRKSVRIQGIPYCVPLCMERALRHAIQKAGSVAEARASRRRIPLGLVLLSRQHLTARQLQTALAAQRAAGCGRIGYWLQELGFVSEQQITSAIACQWSCPVLQSKTSVLSPVLLPQVPMLLLDSFRMIPVSFVAATATMHIAFGDSIDYSVLYAIEQMLDCRTQACVVSPSLLRDSLLALGEDRPSTEVVFERVSGVSEWVGIVSNYAVRVSAREIRLASCRQYSWVRMASASEQTINLLLRLPPDPYFRPSGPPPEAGPIV